MIKAGDFVTYNRYKPDDRGISPGFWVRQVLGDKCIIEEICEGNMKLQLTVNKADLVFLF